MRSTKLVIPVCLAPFVLILLIFAQGCISSSPENGKVACGAEPNPCPDGFYCSTITTTCWKNGFGPDGGGVPSSDGSSDSGGTTSVDGGGSPDVAKALDVGTAHDVSAPDVPLSDAAWSDAPAASPDSGVCPADKVSCNGKCIDPTGCCVAADCSGSCMTCSANNTCIALTAGDDPSGRCAGTCDATGACKSKKGQSCQAVGGGCASGTTCSPDSLCCDKACTGSCEACDVAGSLGTCTTLAANAAPHTGHAACTATDPACVGKCDGTSATCAASTAVCGTASCTSLSYQAAGNCSAGVCKLPAAVTCTNACVADSGGCTGVCTPNAVQCTSTGVPQKCSSAGAWQDQPACANGFTCAGGACTCAGAKTTCSAACVDLQTDASNCGACGHGCMGGTCLLGMCQAITVVGSLDPYPTVLGVDAQYLYYETGDPNGNPAHYLYRVSKTGDNSAGTLLYTAGGHEGFQGIWGSYLVDKAMGGNYFCSISSASSCSTTYSLITPDGSTTSWRSPSPQYLVLVNASSDSLVVTWYSTSLGTIATFTDNTSDPTLVYNSFFQAGNSVYWIRSLNGDNSLFTASPSTATPPKLKLSSGLTSTMIIVDANAQSVLLWDVVAKVGSLYRVPVVQSAATPTLLTTVVSPPYALLATEDASWVYWFDGDGSLNRCAPANCSDTTITLAIGQQADAALFQDSTALYWANSNPPSLMRLAK